MQLNRDELRAETSNHFTSTLQTRRIQLLKVKLQSKLHDAWFVSRHDLSVSSGRYVRVYTIEVGVIENVETLSSELHADTFADSNILE